MRIVIVTPLFPTSEEPYRGNAIYETAKALQKHAEVQVVCPLLTYPDWIRFRPRSFRYNRINKHYQPGEIPTHYIEYPALPVVTRPLNGTTCTRYITPVLRKLHPDIILAYWIYPEGLGAVKAGNALGIPVITGSRGSDLHGNRDPFSSARVKQVLDGADFVITVSEALRRTAIERGADPKRVRTIQNGCDGEIFHHGSRSEARTELGIAQDTELVLFNGWIAPLKGIWDLLEAVRRLAPSHPKLKIACIGEGDSETEWQAAIENARLSDRFRLLRRRKPPEIARWLAASNVLCLPSHTEGCPNAVVEALSCGRAIVATNVGGIPELVSPESAILVSPHKPDELADALELGLRRQWDEQSIATRSRRSWQEVAQETFEVCVDVAGAGRRKSLQASFQE